MKPESTEEPLQEPSGLDDPGRRDVLRALVAMGLVSVAGGGAWGILEATMPRGDADHWHKGVCRYCGTGCGVLVGIGKDKKSGEPKVMDVRGDPDAHNAGRLCIKGSLLPMLMEAPGRLTHPLIRKDGKLVRASWNEAMDLVTKNFKSSIQEHGADSVGFYGSGQLFTEESYTANKLFKGGIGTNNVDGNPRLCMASAAVGYTKTFGKDEPAGCYEDIDHADVFFIIGANPAECHQPLFERIKERKLKNPNVKIVCVDPRRTPTAEHSDIHVTPRPGTDLLLLWSMIHAMDESDLLAPKFIAEHVGFSDSNGKTDLATFKLFLKEYAPEDVAERIGVAPSKIRELAILFSQSKATMSLWTMGLNQRVDGAALNTTMNAIHLLTGQIGRPGATPMSLTGQANACGGVRDTGTLAHALPHGRVVKNPKHRAEMEKLWGVPEGRISPEPGLHALAMFDAMNEGKIKSLLCMCTNPGQSFPNLDKYTKGMERAFMVVVDVFENTLTSQYADVVLPAALWVEKEGVYGQSERRYQLVEKLLEAPGEARSDLEILVDFAERLGHGDLISAKNAEMVWEEYRLLSAHSKYNFAGMTRDRLRKEHGIQWPCPTDDHPGTPRRYVQGDPFVPEGKEHYFYGKPDGRATVFLTPFEARADLPDKEFPLVLNTGRILEQWHTGTMTNAIEKIRENTPKGHFEINRWDARKLGLRNGNQIEVTSRYGSLKGPCKISTNTLIGTIFATFYDSQFPINRLVTDKHDPESKQPDFKITAVRVRRV